MTLFFLLALCQPPDLVITGRVVDQDGNGVEGVTMHVLTARYDWDADGDVDLADVAIAQRHPEVLLETIVRMTGPVGSGPIGG